ncbi:toprim domain-containing protein, partial [Nocardia nova]
MTGTPQGSWAAITAALEREVGPGRPSGSWVKYCCPVHEAGGTGHHPSLAVKYDANQQRTKVKCFAGCDDRDVLDKLHLQVKDLFDNPIERARGQRRAAPRLAPRKVTRAERAIDAAGLPLRKAKNDYGRQRSAWKTTATYPYAREDGTVAGEVVRREARFEHGRDKQFFQRRWSETGWEDSGFEPIPFELPRVLAAIEAGEPIYICEGEKDVLTAEAAGLTATTNAGGALSWSGEHAKWLTGAGEVVIVADHDAPGYRRAEKVMDSLAGRVGSVRVLRAATGKDLTDHIEAGHGIDELEPVPYLDPHTTSAAAAAPLAAEQIAVTAGRSAAQAIPDLTTTTQEAAMGEPVFTKTDDTLHHDDTVDHFAQHFSRVMQLLMQQIMQFAQASAERNRRAQEAKMADDIAKMRENQERHAAEQKAVETRLAKMRSHGWERMSRSEIVAAMRDAAVWSDDSDAAKRAMNELAGHIRGRWGVHVDTGTGHVTVDAPELVQRLSAAER